MTTLLLSEQLDNRYFRPHRAGARERMLARVCAWRLDDALARGVAPDSSAALLLRAHRLIGPAARADLARSIRSLIDDAGRPCHPLNPGVPINCAAVSKASATMIQVADRLVCGRAVDARGVAQVRRLVQDGASPVFNAASEHDLGQLFDDALEALEPRAT